MKRKGNPNPSPATRFTAENHPKGGRPKGSRDKLSADFIAALSKDFGEHGEATIAKVREDDPSTYVRVIAGIVPKEMQLKSPLESLSDEMLEIVIERIRAAMEQPAAEKPEQITVN